MYIEVTYSFFLDPQTQSPAAFCAHCGGERYAPGKICLRCERGLL